MSNQQESSNSSPRTPSRPGAALAVAGAFLLGIAAVAAGISNHEEPAARYVVVECQGFDALASVGGRHVSCATEPVEADATDVDGDDPGPAQHPATQSAIDAAGRRAKV